MSTQKHKELFSSGLAERLRIARKEAKLTQQEAAEAGEVTVQSWRNYEAGRAEPKISTLLFLAKKNVSLSWLVSGEGAQKLGDTDPLPNQEKSQAGIIEEWARDVREKEGHDGRIVMELSLQVPEFREWYKEKKNKSGGVEVGSPHKNVA